MRSEENLVDVAILGSVSCRIQFTIFTLSLAVVGAIMGCLLEMLHF